MSESTKSAIIGSVVGAVAGVVLTTIVNLLLAANLDWLRDLIPAAIAVVAVVSLGIALIISDRKRKAAEDVHVETKEQLERAESKLKEAEEQLERAESKIKESNELLSRYKKMGIVTCTDYLKDTNLAPMSCMPNVKRTLSFLGVGGSKWVMGHSEQESFRKMLKRVGTHKGKVRFLIIDPTGVGYRQLAELRGEDAVPIDSYRTFYKLAREHDSLEVRLYDHLPSFRLQFVDDSYLAASRYYFERERHNKFSGGWEIPHLIVHSESLPPDQDPEYMGSLYESFDQLFDYLWQSSEPIGKLAGTEYSDDR